MERQASWECGESPTFNTYWGQAKAVLPDNGLMFKGDFGLPLMCYPLKDSLRSMVYGRRVSAMNFCDSVLRSPSGDRETLLVYSRAPK